MSRDPKLDLFDKILKQELGLEYTRQGDVKLNFFPDSGNSGVSVPLVLAGNTDPGLCSASDLPRTGYPYARLEHQEVVGTTGGPIRNQVEPTTDGIEFKSGSYARSRKWTASPRDEIGIKYYLAGSGNDGGGPGSLINFPEGVYKIDAKLFQWAGRQVMSFLYNYTDHTVVLTGSSDMTAWRSGTDTSNSYSSITNNILGEFEVTNSGTSYAICQVCTQEAASGVIDYGAGWGNSFSNSGGVPNLYNLFATAEFWKIG